MKKTICSCSAGLALALSTGTAYAADIQRPGYYSPAPVAPIAYNWVGPYAGVNIGYQWGSVSNVPGSNIEPAGIVGGLTLGYNWQSGQFVYGAETDIQISGAEDTFAPWKFSNPWWGTLRGRVGYSWNSFLLYATGGLAYGEVSGENLALSEDKTQVGWTLGLGTEVALNARWSAKAEYLYVDLGDSNFTVTGTKNGFWTNVLRFGVNYRF